MTANGWLQIALFTVLIALLVRPLGGYMTRVFQGEPTVLGRLFGPDACARHVPVLAIAGSRAAKHIVPRSAGTLPTNGSLFVMFLVGVICIVGGLTFLPALSLGPVAEHLAMQAGRLY